MNGFEKGILWQSFSSLMMAGKCERMIEMCQVIYRYMNLCEWDGKQRKKD